MSPQRILDLGELRVDALDAQTSTWIVYGGKGMGKTNFGSVFAEEFSHAGLRFSYLDPYGVAWGLKWSADGKGEGLPILKLGGQRADIPLLPTSQAAESAADLVADEDVSVLIDISRHANGKMWSQGERIRFVRDYCNHLFMRQGEQRRPLMQIIDECGRFAPQTFPRGAEHIAECLGAIEQLTEIGRNVGIGVALLTQRSARMNKSVSELADTMVAFRTVGPNSIDAIVDWFGEHVPRPRQKELVESIRQLPVGTALVVSPGWLQIEGAYAMRARQTFDSSKTPRAGETHRVKGKGAQVDVEKYRTRMAEVEVAAAANDPAQLKREMAVLRRNLEAAKSAPAKEVQVTDRTAAVRIKRLEKALEAAMRFIVQINVEEIGGSLTDADRAELAKAMASAVDAASKRIDATLDARARRFEQLKRSGRKLLAELEKLAGDDVTIDVAVRRQDSFAVEAPQTDGAGRLPLAPPVAIGDITISPSQRKILDALAFLRSIRQDPARKVAVALVAGYSANSGGFNNYMGALRSAGLIDYPSGGMVKLTDAGSEIAQDPGLVDEEKLRETVYARVGGSKAKILKELVAIYPTTVSREELAARTGYQPNSGGYNNYLGSLKSLGLLDYPSKGHVRATDALFVDTAA